MEVIFPEPENKRNKNVIMGLHPSRNDRSMKEKKNHMKENLQVRHNPSSSLITEYSDQKY